MNLLKRLAGMLIFVSRIPPEFAFSLSLTLGFWPLKSNFPFWAQNANLHTPVGK